MLIPLGAKLKDISIHAPARGATEATEFFDDGEGISIHAPARGATISDINNEYNCIISIHAPARGATIWTDFMIMVNIYFNPRSREGSDGKIAHIRNIFSGNYVNLV